MQPVQLQTSPGRTHRAPHQRQNYENELVILHLHYHHAESELRYARRIIIRTVPGQRQMSIAIAELASPVLVVKGHTPVT